MNAIFVCSKTKKKAQFIKNMFPNLSNFCANKVCAYKLSTCFSQQRVSLI